MSIHVNHAGVSVVLTATFYESDGLLEVGENYDSNVIVSTTLRPDAPDHVVATALEEMLGEVGKDLHFEREAK